MIDLHKLSKDLLQIRNQEQFSKYLESYFGEIEEYFDNLSLEEIDKSKFNIEDLLYDLEDNKLINKDNSNIVNAFLILLSQKFEQANLIGAITHVLNFLPECSVKKRLEASKIYLKVNDITKDYHSNFDRVLKLISESIFEEEGNSKAVNSVINFYIVAFSQFFRIKDKLLAQTFKNLVLNKQVEYKILENQLVIEIISELTIENFETNLPLIRKKLSSTIKNKDCLLNTTTITKEISNYSNQLYALKNPTFDKIRKISFDYIKSIGDPQELYDRLTRGAMIIDDEQLLYKYIASFGAKHKAKLYDAFETIKDKLNEEKINIIDWGCGQAFATMMLLEFAKEKNINLNISSIYLIEPSRLALSRGLLHIDIVKQKEYKIKAINCDLDCLKEEDIKFADENKTLHIFSNILDLESFKLNNDFFQKISKNINSDNLFVCVSPKINDKRNSRIDLFYKYFDENFNTELVSFKSDDIEGHKRYEKIFEVRRTKVNDVIQVKNEIKDCHIDIYSKLNNFNDIVSPIMDTQKIQEYINLDPDYVIFKIRKVAEAIVSRIYSQYENNADKLSQNDKIRYLSFEKKILNKKVQSHFHTIRTIGNLSAHEDIENPIKLQKEDAQFIIVALILAIEELKTSQVI